MKSYQRDFIDFAMDSQVLRFGSFTLKSGRQSPFFFNAGLFNDGRALAKLGAFYAQALVERGLLELNVTDANGDASNGGAVDATAINDQPLPLLFGPAYKGIPLVASTAVALYTRHDVDLAYAFNRKEAKNHGEGGLIVGTPLDGRSVIIVDDVITAGTAIRESLAIIHATPGAHLHSVVVALDRQERGSTSELSAIQELEKEHGVRVVAIVTLEDVLERLMELDRECQSAVDGQRPKYAEHIQNIRRYREEFGSR